MTAATRVRAHLAAGTFAARYPAAARGRIERLAGALVLVPWALFVLAAGWPLVARAVAVREAFPDTGNPGYFVVKGAMALLAVLVLAQAAVTILRKAGR